ncbi:MULTISPECIES: GGDEF domain-containing phosphodiesterase [Actinoplanes]|uniref:putative bifunctional diguanylate cyclase/phosphodiesterase n=1 Tax=Actinoplanes TaxID=1865 RepID=UPI0006973115|nr:MULTISPECIES: GGDEF domain-containing phosphodiesterase [Actinoplanes]GLY04359.1 bifunctional diguanylate cyclase/phosphodiesterase [Actinoplanes sp. NBRC 101535]
MPSRAGRRWAAGLAGLSVAAVAGQVIGLLDRESGPWITILTLVVLDVVGAVCCFRAARRSGTKPGAWWLIAAGRLTEIVTFGLYAVAQSTGGTFWLAAMMISRTAMYVCFALGAFGAGLGHFRGRRRAALVAEVGTVLGAGFMAIWYVALEPVLAHESPRLLWIGTIAWPLGDLLMLTAVAAIILRGAVTRFAAPVTVYTVGIGIWAVADILMTRTAATHSDVGNMVAGWMLIAAGVLVTAAPLVALSSARDLSHHPRITKAPAWSTYLPMVAMICGGLFMLAVTLIERQFMPWGGLVLGLTLMTCAAAGRQMLSLRDSRALLITDALTGLANRAGLDDGLDRAMKRGEHPAILLIDLDGFKLVNDAYGHAVGDAYLVHVAHQLRGGIRGKSTIARIGGDEFAVLLTEIVNDEQAGAVCKRLLASMAAHPVVVDDDTLPVRASIGAAVHEPGLDDKTLIRRADVAMYQSKRAGSHGFTLYQPGMVDRRAADAAIADDLQQALGRNEMKVVYQPIVDTATGHALGAEALLRWQHTVRGLIRPDEFIPVAERSGTIIPIGLWVLEQALIQLLACREEMYISVNLSPRQLREPTIVHDVLAVLERTGAPARRLILEITESALVDDNSGIAALHELRSHGIRIAVDDFGTGYSSLQYLTRLPVDILKIDRSFVAELDGSPEGAAVTTAIIHLATVLRLRTIAEGIETPAQADELRILGCTTGQGYLYAKPLTPEELATRVRAEKLSAARTD